MNASIMTLHRFGIVAVAGLVVDLALATRLAAIGAPLPLAAAAGFVAGAAFNYVLHELWTFREGRIVNVSAGRAGLYLGVLAIVLAARVETVSIVESLMPSLPDLAALIAGVSVSFSVNWLLSRHFVFRPKAGKETQA